MVRRGPTPRRPASVAGSRTVSIGGHDVTVFGGSPALHSVASLERVSATRRMKRAETAMGSSKLAALKRKQAKERGHFLHTLGIKGGVEQFKCTIPVGGKGSSMRHPGLVLPQCYQSAQSLFGTLPNKAGSGKQLRFISGAMPKGLPRYMTHDVKSASSSGYSNFVKTRLSFCDTADTKGWRSEYRGRFDNKWIDDDDEDLATVGLME